MQKITVFVTETLMHKVELELEEDALNSLLDDLDGPNGDETAGDLCSQMTIENGEWELESYDVVDDEG